MTINEAQYNGVAIEVQSKPYHIRHWNGVISLKIIK